MAKTGEICRFLEIYTIFRVCLLCQIEVLPFVAEVTWEGPLVTVAKPDVDFQCCQRRAGHVTEGTLHLIHWKITSCTSDSLDQGRGLRIFGSRAIHCEKCFI